VPDQDRAAMTGQPEAAGQGHESPAELARRYSLTRSSARPDLGSYLRDMWQRRFFLVAFANARMESRYSQARLGQLWQLLTPLLNAAVYLLLFGVLLGTDRGVDNFVAFLVTGVFVFSFTQRSILNGADSLSRHLGLIRALHFPRATLPVAYTLAELRQLMTALVVLGAIVLLTGEPFTVAWLLVPVAVGLQWLFNLGAGLIIARIGAQIRDVKQILPFATRAWLYLSGVFFSIPAFTVDAPQAVRVLLSVNPAAVYIELVRDALIASHEGISYAWPLAVFWALVVSIGGFIYFWRAEERYGRG
jgi:teichoic acid transport system permease protein